MKKIAILTAVILFTASVMPVFATSVFQNLADSITGTGASSAAASTETATAQAPAGTSATSVFQSSADTVKQMGSDASAARGSSLRENKEELLKRREGKRGLNP